MPTPVILRIIYVPFLVWIAFIDWREHRIPNVIVVPLLLTALAVALVERKMQTALVGGLAGMGVFLLPVFIYGPDKAGMGDVKYGLFVGLAVGWPSILLSLTITFIFALLSSGIGLLTKKITLQTSIPLAPFITIGLIITFVCH